MACSVRRVRKRATCQVYNARSANRFYKSEIAVRFLVHVERDCKRSGGRNASPVCIHSHVGGRDFMRGGSTCEEAKGGDTTTAPLLVTCDECKKQKKLDKFVAKWYTMQNGRKGGNTE